MEKNKRMQEMIFWFLLLVGMWCLVSCTDNDKVRVFGGTEQISLEPGQKLVNITWKGKDGKDLWFLTTKRDSNEVPKQYTFYEKSSWGILEGKVIINEK